MIVILSSWFNFSRLERMECASTGSDWQPVRRPGSFGFHQCSLSHAVVDRRRSPAFSPDPEYSNVRRSFLPLFIFHGEFPYHARQCLCALETSRRISGRMIVSGLKRKIIPISRRYCLSSPFKGVTSTPPQITCPLDDQLVNAAAVSIFRAAETNDKKFSVRNQIPHFSMRQFHHHKSW